MLHYIGKRLLHLIPVLLGMTVIVFLIIHAIPGDPAQVILGQQATAESIAALRESLGLNNPWYVQYFNYLKDLFMGDLGESLRTRRPITSEVWPYLAATFELAFFAMIIAVIVGMNAGIISAWFQNSKFDYIAMVIALVGVSMPIFWLGLVEQWIFSIELRVASNFRTSRCTGSSNGNYALLLNRYINSRAFRSICCRRKTFSVTRH